MRVSRQIRKGALSLLVYAGILLSGILVLVTPPASFTSSASTLLTITWALLLIIGGGFSGLSVLTRRLWGELLGIPLAAVAVFAWAVVLIVRTTAPAGNIRGSVLVGCLLCSLAGALMHRWIQVKHEMDVDAQPRRQDEVDQ
jgi:hypothetical protein